MIDINDGFENGVVSRYMEILPWFLFCYPEICRVAATFLTKANTIILTAGKAIAQRLQAGEKERGGGRQMRDRQGQMGGRHDWGKSEKFRTAIMPCEDRERDIYIYIYISVLSVYINIGMDRVKSVDKWTNTTSKIIYHGESIDPR